ncbi:hypothetical protein Q644_00655 [Brucella intermedia 229E]|uniref:Uncharacterized protein n=1 Tax=Brucella intermedia 229E TaxID=1337887 RepID=U4VEW0_9HYPH|nr:hypothetical protein Q644_00655 [Brucella intermedia 229E]OOC64636.1 hypothetical protein AS855_10140 [Brucella intermedia M86]
MTAFPADKVNRDITRNTKNKCLPVLNRRLGLHAGETKPGLLQRVFRKLMRTKALFEETSQYLPMPEINRHKIVADVGRGRCHEI